MNTLSRRELALKAAAAVAAALGTPKIFAASAERAPLDDLGFVDPELRPMAREIMSTTSKLPALSSSTLATWRKGMSIAPSAPPSAPRFERRSIKGADGAADIVIYVINGKSGGRRPAILHTHGGGYVMGNPADQIPDLYQTAVTLDCVIVTVDYRLAPETTFAGSIEDNYAALRWLHGHAADLGVDAKRLAVMGESAGGGHAALLALTARDRGEIPLVCQILIYPMLDDRTGTTHNLPSPIGTILWTAEANRFGWRSFLGQEPGTNSVPARAVPARYTNLAGLPPTFIGVGAIDLFVDEDIDYARRLIDAGVATELEVVPGAFHAFDGIAPQTSVAKTFTAAKLNALRRAFAPA